MSEFPVRTAFVTANGLTFEVDLFREDTLDDKPDYVTELKSVVKKLSKKYPNERTAVAVDPRGVRVPFTI
jgi:hypothetical protein